MTTIRLAAIILLVSASQLMAQPEWERTDLSHDAFEPAGIDIGDIDGDGNAEILGTSRADGYVMYWTKENTTWVQTVVDSGLNFAISPVAFDVNVDGQTDYLVCANGTDDIFWYEQDGPNWIQHSIDDNADGAMELALADINEDGLMDIYAVLYYASEVVWYEQQSPMSWIRHSIQTNFVYCNEIDAADMDGDGDLDAVACSYGNDAIEWYENDNGSFTTHTISVSTSGPWSVQTVDMDDDGDIDVLSGYYTGGNVNWFENTGEAWIEHSVASQLGNVRDTEAADFDNDGDMDVMIAAQSTQTIFWYEDVEGSWVQHVLTTGYIMPWRLVLADIDDDGDKDVFATDQTGSQFTFWELLGSPAPQLVDIEIMPFNTTIPPSGGSVLYGVHLTNNTSQTRPIQGWTSVELPNGNVIGPLVRVTFPFQPGSFDIFNLTVEVPAQAPAGQYHLTAYLGFLGIGLIAADDSIPFTKTGIAAGGSGPTDWSASPWEIAADEDGEQVAAMPSEYELLDPYPNPFNAATTIRVSLPNVSELTVAVFDVTGRTVAQLASGAYAPGTHSFSFDGESFASSVYLVRAEVPGRWTQARKLVLVK